MSRIGVVLADQFARTWAELREAIELTPDDEWRNPDPCGQHYLTPVRQALHAVNAAHAYLHRSKEEAFGPEALRRRRFPVDPEQSPVEQLPAKSELLAYLDDTARAVDDRLRQATDAELEAPSVFPWAGGTVCEQWVYMLRHNQHHYAVLNTMLRTRGLPTGQWK